MQRAIVIASMCIISILLFPSCDGGGAGGGSSTASILKGDQTPGDETWTIMIYMDGDNNLEADALDDMNELELVDLAGEGIEVIVLLDRVDGETTADGDWTGTRLYRITADNNTSAIQSERLADSTWLYLTDTGDNEEKNMGDPQTVKDFIDFSQANYPADRYAFIFWNHGGGWRDREYSVPQISSPVRQKSSPKKTKKNNVVNRSVCWDDTSVVNYVLHMSDVESALTGKGIDLVGFDACLMGMVEVVYQLSGETDYVVASSETEPASGWKYDRMLHSFIQRTVNGPEELGRDIVDSYIDYTPYSGITQTLIDISTMDTLFTALNTFATNLQSGNDDDTIAGRYQTMSYSNGHYIDARDFAEAMSAVTGAGDVVDALDAAVVYHRHKGYDDSNGLSIYYPVHSSADNEYSDYNDSVIKFANSGWDEMLADYYSNVTLYTIETFQNNGSGSVYTDTSLIIFSNTGEVIMANDDISYPVNCFSRVTLPLASGETYYVMSYDEWGLTGPYSILFNNGGGGSSTGTPAVSAYEPNNDFGHATPLPINTIQDHYLSYGDVDLFSITVP